MEKNSKQDVAPAMPTIVVRTRVAQYPADAVKAVKDFCSVPYEQHDTISYGGSKGLTWDKLYKALTPVVCPSMAARADEVASLASGMVRSYFPNRPAQGKQRGWNAAVAPHCLLILQCLDFAAGVVEHCRVAVVQQAGVIE